MYDLFSCVCVSSFACYEVKEGFEGYVVRVVGVNDGYDTLEVCIFLYNRFVYL